MPLTNLGKILLGVGGLAAAGGAAGVISHYSQQKALAGAAPGSILVVPSPGKTPSYTLSLKAAGVGAQVGQILVGVPAGATQADATVIGSSNPLVVPVRSYGPGSAPNTTLYVATAPGTTILTIQWTTATGPMTGKVNVTVVA